VTNLYEGDRRDKGTLGLQGFDDGVDEAVEVGHFGFAGGLPALFAHGGGGDGADGDAGDALEGKGHAGFAGDFGEVADAGGAGEGGGIEAGLEGFGKEFAGAIRQDSLVGVDYGHKSARLGEGVGDDVASDLGPGEQDFLADDGGTEGRDDAFGVVVLGDDGDAKTGFARSFRGGAADGGDAEQLDFGYVDLEECTAGSDGLDGVGAGEYKPMEAVKLAQGVVEGVEGVGRPDLEDGDFNGDGAERFEAIAQFAGLLDGASDEYPPVGQGKCGFR